MPFYPVDKGMRDNALSYNGNLLLDSTVNSPVGSVTSRDQIIDPYTLVDQSHYKNTRAGRALYESDLARAKEYQKQQEAAYEEWYGSPEQAALRERAAGINPDLAGLENAGEASQVAPSEAVPGQTLPTNGQMFMNTVNTISSVVGSLSSVASLATAFTDLPLKSQQLQNLKDTGSGINLQNEATSLSNQKELAMQLSGDISGLLGTAVQAHLNSGTEGAFDYDAWFADDNNFSPLEPMYGSYSSYSPALALARNQSLKYHKDASLLQKDAAQNDWDFSNIIGDPRYTPDQKLTAIQVRPFMKACQDADLAENKLREALADWNKKYYSKLNPETSADAVNAANSANIAESGYKEDYYNASDGELVAAFDEFVRECSKIGLNLEKSINTGYQDMYNSDPNGLNGAKAAYLYGSNGGASWNEAYLTRFDDKQSRLIDSMILEAQANGDTAHLRAYIQAIDGIMNLNKYRMDSSIDFVYSVKKTREKLEKAIELLENYE